MSARITISYEHMYELEAIVKALAPMVDEWKVKPGKAPFKHAYLWMKEMPKDEN